MSNVVEPMETANEIEIVVNGAVRRLSAGTTVLALIHTLGLEPGRVAVERNRLILKRPFWGETPVGAGDQLEIVQFVGGG